MKSYEASTRIDASPGDVWDVLTDDSSSTEWDPGVLRLDGRAVKGSKVVVTAAVSPKRPFEISVAELEPPKNGSEGRMVWSSGMPFDQFVAGITARVEQGGAS